MMWAVKPLVDKRVAVPDDFDPSTLMLVFDEIAPGFDEHNNKVKKEAERMLGPQDKLFAAFYLASLEK